jgi:hypothetical protein
MAIAMAISASGSSGHQRTVIINQQSISLVAGNTRMISFGLVGMIPRSKTSAPESVRLSCPGDISVVLGLTLRSSRTPPALPSALSQLLATSAPLVVSVQAWPLSFIR